MSVASQRAGPRPGSTRELLPAAWAAKPPGQSVAAFEAAYAAGHGVTVGLVRNIRKELGLGVSDNEMTAANAATRRQCDRFLASLAAAGVRSPADVAVRADPRALPLPPPSLTAREAAS